MAYVIAEPCIGTKDTACVDVCPVDCIHPRKDEAGFEAEKQLYIHPDECIDCGACVPVCPVTAIFALEDLPEKWTSYTPVNADWFKNKKAHGPVTAIYPGSRLHFFEMLKNVRYEDYEITYRTENRFQFMGNGYTECEISPDGDPVWYFDDPFTKV